MTDVTTVTERTCFACGKAIRVMCFLNTGACCERCHDRLLLAAEITANLPQNNPITKTFWPGDQHA
jgi:hypothetical protein